MEETQWISIQEAAHRRSVSVATIRRYITQGRVRASRFGPKLIRIDSASIDDAAQPIGSTSIQAQRPTPNHGYDPQGPRGQLAHDPNERLIVQQRQNGEWLSTLVQQDGWADRLGFNDEGIAGMPVRNDALGGDITYGPN